MLERRKKGEKVKHEDGVSDADIFDTTIIKNKIKALEVKIWNKNVLLNEGLCKNKKLKESIDHLRSEK